MPRFARPGDQYLSDATRDPVAVGLGAIVTGTGLGGAVATLAQIVVALMRQHLPEVAYRDAAPDPLLFALLAPLVVGAFFGWRRSQAIENIWQRGVIAVLSAIGALVVGMLGSVADWLLNVPGMVLWAAFAMAAGIAGSRWAVRGAGPAPSGVA